MCGVRKSTANSKKILKKILNNRCNYILHQEFEEGYCIGDYMHRMRFLSAYEEEYGEELSQNGEELEQLLQHIGHIRDNRIFFKDDNSKALLSVIYRDVVKAFKNGACSVYYECLYEKYADRLTTEMSVYSADSLKSLMKNDRNFPKGYVLERKTITKEGINFDTTNEIENILKNSHVPMTLDEIKAKLQYVPLDKIKLDLQQIPSIVRVENFTYFYAPNFYIPTEEKASLITSMHSAIYRKGYLVAKNLREIFKSTCPSASIDSEFFSDYAIRNILSVLLQENFAFSNSVISEKGNSLDYGQLYRNYVAEREQLSLSELEELSEELGVAIYWDDVFHEMIRISETKLVGKDTVQFNVTEIDNKLEEIYPDDYTPLKDITLFLALPPISVRWNGFVLESYLREYSKKFCLMQVGVSKDNYFGVMLRNTSELKTYEDVVADMLAKNNNWTDEKTALNLLVDMKFQPKATNKKISSIIKVAKQKRLNLQQKD